MFCSACGSEISLAAEACPACGRVVAPVGVAVRAGIADTPIVATPGDSWPSAGDDAVRALAPLPATPSAAASIFAGDLDVPGLPRDQPRRVALLTSLGMVADLLLPWVTVNGKSYALVRMGAPVLALPLALLLVIVPMMVPSLRRRPLARVAPLCVGSLLLGATLSLWFCIGILGPALTTTMLNRLISAGASAPAVNIGAALVAMLQVAPALGLFLFLGGACVLVVSGYRALPIHDQR